MLQTKLGGRTKATLGWRRGTARGWWEEFLGLFCFWAVIHEKSPPHICYTVEEWGIEGGVGGPRGGGWGGHRVGYTGMGATERPSQVCKVDLIAECAVGVGNTVRRERECRIATLPRPSTQKHPSTCLPPNGIVFGQGWDVLGHYPPLSSTPVNRADWSQLVCVCGG
jgi:hypothetical protein